MNTANPQESYIREKSLTGFQILAISLCALINVLDGFDALAIAYAAPAISMEWGLSPGSLGAVFSAGYMGMAAGAVILSPFSDRIGRRNMILLSLIAITVFMGLTATANTVNALLLFRFCTGLAIGSMLASITAVTAEYSPDSKRNFMISIVQGTYAIGAMLGGLVAAFLIEDFGWRSVFVTGAILNAVMIILAYLLLPESLAFLISKRPKNGLPLANEIIARLGGSKLSDWPAQSDSQTSSETGIKALFDGDLRVWSPLLWITTFSAMFGSYFLLSWIPKIVVDAGLPLDKAIMVGMSINAGGLVGILFLGYRSAASGLRPMVMAFLATAGVLMMIFGALNASVGVLMLIAAALGFFSLGGFIGLYSVAARLYPTQIRATGVGWAIGLGRLGAIVGPVAGGILIGLGWSQATYFAVLAIPFLIGAAAIGLLRAQQLVPMKP